MTLYTTETGISQRVGDYSVLDNEESLLSIMFGINVLIFRLLITSYVTTRQHEVRRLKELQVQYPEKSVEEIYAEFAYNDERLHQLFFGQLRGQQNDNNG